MKILLYSKDPKENYTKIKQSFKYYLILIIVLFIGLSLQKRIFLGLTMICILLVIYGIELKQAQQMLDLVDKNVIERAYRQGRIINWSALIGSSVLLGILVDWKYAIIWGIVVLILEFIKSKR